MASLDYLKGENAPTIKSSTSHSCLSVRVSDSSVCAVAFASCNSFPYTLRTATSTTFLLGEEVHKEFLHAVDSLERQLLASRLSTVNVGCSQTLLE
jgi:hypothetical protein